MIYVRAIYLSNVKVARQVTHGNVKRMLPSDMSHGLPGLGGLGVGGPQMERWKLYGTSVSWSCYRVEL